MDLQTALDFARERTKGVVMTIRGNGRPQASNIMYACDGGSPIRISVTDDRAKTRNAARDPRVSLHVTSDDFWQWVVIEATCELSDVVATPGDGVCRELRDVYEAVSGGPHPDWNEFDEAMVDQSRRVMRLVPDRAYGQVSAG